MHRRAQIESFSDKEGAVWITLGQQHLCQPQRQEAIARLTLKPLPPQLYRHLSMLKVAVTPEDEGVSEKTRELIKI